MYTRYICVCTTHAYRIEVSYETNLLIVITLILNDCRSFKKYAFLRKYIFSY